MDDKRLSYLIASYPEPELIHRHDRKNNILINLILLMAVIGVFVGYVTGIKVSPEFAIGVASAVLIIQLLLVYGFYRYKAGFYTFYILLEIISIPRKFDGFMEQPIGNAMVIGLSIAMLSYVWYVRSRLFPDLGLLGAQRDKNKEYIFST